MQNMKLWRTLAIALGVSLATAGAAQAQTWTSLINQPTFTTDTALMLTDGTVMMHQYSSTSWWRLTPDNTGSYLNGTWAVTAPMPGSYKPLYFASAVLPDGRVIVEGGEYNNGIQNETNLGAIYDPAANTWATVTAPSGWSSIGDSPGIVLASGTFLLGQNSSTKTALLNATTLTWTTTGTGKKDNFSEEGWVLLPDQTILTTDTARAPNAEKYVPRTGKWVSAANTIVNLTDPGSLEVGPMLLMPTTGQVFATGGKASGSGHTSLYTVPSTPSAPGFWTPGPDFPNGNDMADAPMAILPDGNALCDTSPGVFNSPVTFYEFNGTSFVQVPSPASNGSTSYQGRMVVIPTGQILFSVADGTTKNVALYDAAGTYNPAWAPGITTVPSTLTHGVTYTISGIQFNGLDAGANYGDDAQMSSGYPLVRITNTGTGHVFYAKTHNHSTMAVATGSRTVSTKFDVPTGIETGASTIEVVANGIPSPAVSVSVN